MTADATATFALVLEDGISSPAADQARSLADLKEKIDEDTKSLSQMRKAMRQMTKAGLGTSESFKQVSTSVDAMEAKLGIAQQSFSQLDGAFGELGDSTKVSAKKAADAAKTMADDTAKAAAKAAKALESDAAKAAKKAGTAFDKDLKDKAKEAGEATKLLGDQVSGLGGPLGGMATKLSSVGKLLANPIGIAIALAAAFVALAAAVVVATVALTRFAIVSADARRSEALQIEGLNTLRHQWGRSTASVDEFTAAIDRASDSTNLSRGQLQGYARQLSRAGLRGAALTEGVEAMGIAQMVQGDRGAARFRALAMNARLTGGSVRDLAADFRDRLGPIARRQMLSLGNQSERFRRSLTRIFSGVRIEGFLESLDEMLSLFSQSTATGRALKLIAETILNPLIDSLRVVGPIMKRFFQGFVIGALIMIIWIQRASRFVRNLFGIEIVRDMHLARAALFLGIGAFVAMIVVVGILTAITLIWLAGIALVIGAFLILPALVLAFGFAIGFALAAIVDWFATTDFGALAQSMITGLVRGLRNGAAAVRAAVINLANGARNAFRSAMGIDSPSTVFAEFGMNIAEGAQQGIEAGTPGVEDAAGALVDSPEGGGLGGATSLSFGDINVQAGEGVDARQVAVSIRDELASILEGVGIELGAPA